MGSSSAQSSDKYDLSYKVLLVGDSGVGKSSILVSFVSNAIEDLLPTIGVDFKIKLLSVGGKKLKLTIWDTAGQERYRTLTSTFYRDAHGIILVYNVTRRETFTNLSDVWAKEVELYSTNQDCVKMLVGNKVDMDSERVVSREEGITLAKELGCLFLECSAKTRVNVEQCFEKLSLKIMEVPSLLEAVSTAVKSKAEQQATPSAPTPTPPPSAPTPTPTPPPSAPTPTPTPPPSAPTPTPPPSALTPTPTPPPNDDCCTIT